MRPFLALDTATEHVAIAVGDLDAPGAVLAAEGFVAPRAANTVLLLAAERVIERAGVTPGELAAIACGRGPGSFTGVRIAVATAKGLAYGAHAPLVGFGTADAVAHAADMHDGLLGVVGDAMRGEVYPALFRVSGASRERLSEDEVVRPEDAAAAWASLGEPLVLTGSGLAKHEAVFVDALGDRTRVLGSDSWAPSGASLIAAAWAESGPLSLSAVASLAPDEAWRAAHPGALLPIYTRLSDAEEAERGRTHGRAVPAEGVAGPEAGQTL